MPALIPDIQYLTFPRIPHLPAATPAIAPNGLIWCLKAITMAEKRHSPEQQKPCPFLTVGIPHTHLVPRGLSESGVLVASLEQWNCGKRHLEHVNWVLASGAKCRELGYVFPQDRVSTNLCMLTLS